MTILCGRSPRPAGDEKKQRQRLADGKVRGRSFKMARGVGGRQQTELVMGSGIAIAARKKSDCKWHCAINNVFVCS